MTQEFSSFKRTTIHNLRITASDNFSDKPEILEGLILPRNLMRLSDIAPYERVLVTKQGGDNWKNRIYTFVVPGDGPAIEVRGCLAHLLTPGDLCCIISTTYLDTEQYSLYRLDRLTIPIIDIRFQPENGQFSNDFSNLNTVIEFADHKERITEINDKIIVARHQFPRIMLSNLVSRLRVTQIERQCLEMSAELPLKIMKSAGLARNQTIFVYNSSRGGMSAESYVVPNERDSNVIISGALSNLADVNDVISEAAFTITDNVVKPIILNFNIDLDPMQVNDL